LNNNKCQVEQTTKPPSS